VAVILRYLLNEVVLGANYIKLIEVTPILFVTEMLPKAGDICRGYQE